jgi:predicted ArsR family transcriptional regulator
MYNTPDTGDGKLLELLRSRGAMSVTELTVATEVTPTAVRQRLARLMRDGLVARVVSRGGRGRPSHRYSLTEKARRQVGSNFADLAIVLWQEVRAIKDPEVRRGLLARIAQAMAAMYGGAVAGNTIKERMKSVAELLADRDVAVHVEGDAALPILTVNECPYPGLAEQDAGICAVEKMLFSQLLARDVRLSQCRLEGHACCQFQTN